MNAVVAAIPEELRSLRRRVRVRERRRIGGRRCDVGDLEGARVSVLATGDGAARARAGLEALLEALPVRMLFLIGVAGAASPGLPPGSVVAPRRVFDGERPAPPPDPGALARALDRPGTVPGVLVTVDRVVISADARAEIALRHPGERVIVDLETATWASIAATRRIPYLALRAVSDATPDDLPRWLDRCLGKDGRVDRWKVVSRAAAAPWELPKLLRLRRRVRLCAEELEGRVRDLLREG